MSYTTKNLRGGSDIVAPENSLSACIDPLEQEYQELKSMHQEEVCKHLSQFYNTCASNGILNMLFSDMCTTSPERK
jgi:hypothetical protein